MTSKKCGKCQERKSEHDIQERHSYGVYAGVFCTDCCYSYRDHCGIDGDQGTPGEYEDMGGVYYEEEW